MNEKQLYDKILAVARNQPPDERTPYAFEKRIMANLTSVAEFDIFTLWSRSLWRAAIACVALALVTGAWTSLDNQQAQLRDDGPTLETALMAPISLEESW